MSDLLPYRALVGGSTQGIGRAVAQLLAERGCGLTLLARNEDRLRETVAALPTPTGHVHIKATLHVIGIARIEAPVCAFKDVYKVHIVSILR